MAPGGFNNGVIADLAVWSRRVKRFITTVLLSIIILCLVLAAAIRIRYGGGTRFEDRTTDPLLPPSSLQVVVDLPKPPGNIAVSKTGRVFFTFHPEAHPDIKVAELVNGEVVPYPNAEFQKAKKGTPRFETPLALRIDQQDRLWALDYASHGFGQPRLLAFDLKTNAVVHQYDFPSEVASLGSMVNDFQVDPEGRRIYIAEASIFRKTPALIVYDSDRETSRRLLENDPSVQAKPFITNVAGRDMVIWGIFAVRPGVDSIALDKRGEWLYYAAVTNDHLYRVRTKDLNDPSLTSEQLAARVEVFGAKTMSDGLSMDILDNVYITDMEHSAILLLGQDRKLKTRLKDPRLRWPDGLSFGPDGWLYVTCSALHHVIFKSQDHIRSQAPYQIFRFKPDTPGIPGH